MMTRSQSGLAALVLSLLVGACIGRAPGSASPSAVATTASAAATTAYPSPVASATPDPEPTLAPPPVATLVAGAVLEPGEPGSWTWAGGSNAAPWLPATALDLVEIAAGPVEIDLAGVAVESWTARAAAAADVAGASPVPLGEGAGPPAFQAPAAGSWVVSVQVVFANGLGDASYYWHLEVR